MNQIDEDFGAVICGPSGNVLRANHAIFFHPDQFFYFNLTFPLREMTELSGIYKEYDAKRMTSNDLWERYCCLDGDTGQIKEKVQTQRHFSNYFGGGNDGDGGVFERDVRPFLGWNVVCDDALFPENMYDIFKILSLRNKHWQRAKTDVQSPKHQRKRGPKPSAAKREFEERYPDGIPENLSAEAIAAELTEDGFAVTGRTVLNYNQARNVRK